MDDTNIKDIFTFFNEIGIIHQLTKTRVEEVLPDGLLISHFSVVSHLMRVRDGQTPLVLARAFQVPKTTMTHTLSGCVAHGLVDIRPNPKDARSKCVWVTEVGRRFRDQAIADVFTRFGPVLGQLDLEKMTTMLPELSEIRRVLDEARNGNDQEN